MATKLPPHVNAEAHRAFMNAVSKMSSAEIVGIMKSAGVYDAAGKLTPEFGGAPRKKKARSKR